jgi:hypothetical protein
MKTICKQCNKEFEAKRSTGTYCSPHCRKLAFLSVPRVSVPDELVETEKEILKNELEKIELIPQDICDPKDIEHFPNMCQTKVETAEATYMLDNNDLEDLKEAGVWIPNRYEKRTHLKG